MNAVAQVSAGLSALILIVVFPLEAFLIERGWVQRFLGIQPDGLANVRLWSFCLGFRNALGGIGILIGLWGVNFGDPASGRTILILSCWYVLLASLAMGAADLLGLWLPRGGSVKGTLASSLLPAIALVALLVG